MMKTAGLLGGMSWQSSQYYYQMLNSGVQKKLGGFSSAQIILNSVDFGPIEQYLKTKQWPEIATALTTQSQAIEAAGADFLMICTNTMHNVAEHIESHINIPLLHIADATASVLVERNIQNVGLLGTAFTMEQNFYKGRLNEKFDMTVYTPDAADRDIVHRIIFDELCQGVINETSKQEYLRIIETLASMGAEAVILGCTEIGLLIQQTDTDVPLVDTTEVHAEAAVQQMLS